ncbi:MAG: DUF554 domain-containing protein [Candidatus Mcinerneyibacterium aminivorans]|uniref:DUF554 domain-containing protein n=1 Tax=Candidatus Mcinerneyibacterium aminivorans TaxID=2703815 RepID=A0A5D0MCM8_9BACT|nr:MAG: DUF554 domain-containing protein [Candidatus Mcinerneyibacterium aminivorans]
MFTGTIVNAGAVIIGSLIGIVFHKNFPKNFKRIVFNGLGLATIFLGITMALNQTNFLILIFSILLGGLIGEFIKLEHFLTSIGNRIKKITKSENDKFVEGMIAAFLLFCMGSMTFVGSIDAGLRGNNQLLFTKSLMDFFASTFLASTYGIGVLFSFIPLLIFQGGLTISASYAEVIFTDPMINNLTAVGGLIIIALGLNLLDLKEIKVANFLPALLIVILLSLIFL